MIMSLESIVSRPTALVVIDMQNDYCLPEGIIGQLGYDVSPARQVGKNISTFLARARALVDCTIFVRTEIPSQLKSQALVSHYARNNLGRRVAGGMQDWFAVEPQGDDQIVTKHRYSPFVDTPFAGLLRARRIETLIVMGVTAEVCVESTVRDAFMRDYTVVVLQDCTYGSTPERQRNALSVMDTFFARVAASDDVLAALIASRSSLQKQEE